MAHVGGLQFVDFEEGIPLTSVEFFKIEDVLIKRDRFLDVINLDRDVIASVNLYAHFLSRFKAWIISPLRLRSSLWCTLANSSISFWPLAVSLTWRWRRSVSAGSRVIDFDSTKRSTILTAEWCLT